ncbi:hypothetical protein AAMO2058_000490300 [Amorphochlora amoebiformis]
MRVQATSTQRWNPPYNPNTLRIQQATHDVAILHRTQRRLGVQATHNVAIRHRTNTRLGYKALPGSAGYITAISPVDLPRFSKISSYRYLLVEQLCHLLLFTSHYPVAGYTTGCSLNMDLRRSPAISGDLQWISSYLQWISSDLQWIFSDLQWIFSDLRDLQ